MINFCIDWLTYWFLFIIRNNKRARSQTCSMNGKFNRNDAYCLQKKKQKTDENPHNTTRRNTVRGSDPYALFWMNTMIDSTRLLTVMYALPIITIQLYWKKEQLDTKSALCPIVLAYIDYRTKTTTKKRDIILQLEQETHSLSILCIQYYIIIIIYIDTVYLCTIFLQKDCQKNERNNILHSIYIILLL